MKKPETRFYRHYKNKPYKLIGTARHSETLEELAYYESLYDNAMGRLWVRPKDMFFENVTIEGVSRPRFEKIQFKFQHLDVLTEKQWFEIAEVFEAAFSEKFLVEKAMKKNGNFKITHAVLCYDGTQLVGFKIGYAPGADLFYSWLGGVRPEFQNLGIASALMYEVLTWAKQSGFSRVQTKTMSKYREMLSLNLKFGFEIIGTEVEPDQKLKILMEKVL